MGGSAREVAGAAFLVSHLVAEDKNGNLSHVSGKVPAPGDRVNLEGYRFEALEANQRKVLRLRARHLPASAQTAPH